MIKQRLLNFEFLRIISMFLIVLLHCIYHMDINETKYISSYLTINTMVIIAKTSVNIFVLLTGYFLISNENPLERIFKLFGIVIFYQLILGLFCFYILGVDGKINILDIFNPFKYWFINNYLALILLSPFLNILIDNLSKQNYIVVLFSFIICNVFFGNLTNVHNGFSLIWFVNLFFVGRFFRIYSFKYKRKIIVNSILLLMFFVLLINLIIYNRDVIFSANTSNFKISSIGSYSHIFTFLFSILFFILFKKTTYKNNIFSKLGNISPYLLGVYLIHDNIFLKEVLWNNILTHNFFSDSIINPIVIIFYTFCLFVLCVILDFFRTKIFNYFKYPIFIKSISKYTLSLFNKILESIKVQIVKD